jgi:hypothetical protein
MKTNVGSYDAGLRFVLGCLILMLYHHGLGAWALLGVLPLISAVTNFCAIYFICGLNSAAWEERWERRHGR